MSRQGRVAKRRARSPWRRRVGLVALLLTPLIAAVLYKRAERYVERDPAFCALCHERKREFDLWTDRAHRKIRCQSCHHESQRARVKMLIGYVFSGPPASARNGSGSGSGAGPRAKAARAHAQKPAVVIDACASCHAKHDSDWAKTKASVGHRAHIGTKRKGKEVTCVSCHVRSAHRLTDPRNSCSDCHADHTRSGDKMQKLHCNACHGFLAKRRSLQPTTTTCVECHRLRKVKAADLQSMAAMGQFNCSACHRPHAKRGARRVSCKSCHERIASHGLHGNDEHSKCTSCHGAHDWTPTRARCNSCHDDVEHKNKPPDTKDCWRCHSFRRATSKGARE